MSAHGPGVSRRFPDDARGGTTVEFALVGGAFLLLALGTVDAGRILWVWNAAAKATQVGVRHAAVNAAAAVAVRDFSGLTLVGLRPGDAIPVDAPGTEPIACSSTGCDGDPFGLDAAAFDAVVARMQEVLQTIAPANVVIEYRNAGLGAIGLPRELGSELVPAVTVRLQGLTLQPITPGIGPIALPGFATTLTAEALRTP